jgi:hypothetical protein
VNEKMGPACSVAVTERIHFVADVCDSHNSYHKGQYIIPVTGEYAYMLKGMPAAKGYFHAGDKIPYDPVFVIYIK